MFSPQKLGHLILWHVYIAEFKKKEIDFSLEQLNNSLSAGSECCNAFTCIEKKHKDLQL